VGRRRAKLVHDFVIESRQAPVLGDRRDTIAREFDGAAFASADQCTDDESL
jgi:hypothetical protein